MPKRYDDDDAYGVTQAMEYDTRSAGAGVAALSWIIALLWIAAAAGFVYFNVGMDALAAMRPEVQAGFCVVAILPALLILFAGAAAREGARARAQSHVLSAAAEKMLTPSASAEAGARKLSQSVRNEIATLEHAIDQAMAKAREVEQLITRQTQAIEGASHARMQGAAQLLDGMERERAALMQISQDLNAQAAAIGQSISRHAASISEAAHTAHNDIRMADGELNARMASFSAATTKIGERTGALTKAAQTSAESAHRLESILGGALDALTKATSLTDAARQSAEAATSAANHTANAVRDTTFRAVEDAKRAAEVIRGESAAVEREAATALERLHEAAEAARYAAQNVRAISTETAADLTRFAHQPVTARQEPESAPAPAPAPVPAQRPLAPHELRFTAPTQPAPVVRPEPQPAPQPAVAQTPKEEPFATTADRGRPMVTLSPRPPGDPGPAPGQAWTWRDVLASVDEGHVVPLEPRRQAHAAAQAAAQNHPASHGALAVSSRPRHPIEAINIIDAVGVQLSDIFAPNMLDRVAQRARNGAHARRRAVRDAAPEAVEALTAYLAHDPDSRAATADFLRSEGPRLTELLGRGRAAMQADITRAFLLLDAASG